MVFVDFAKAYDSIDRAVLWQRMEEMGIPSKLIRMMQVLCRRTRNRVRATGYLSEDFLTTSGVRQGDSLSPTMFNLALESAMRRVLARIGKDVRLMAYADDIVILAPERGQLEEAMRILIKECEEIGLAVNQEKTKYMPATHDPQTEGDKEPMRVEGHSYEAVRVFKYLGSYITWDNDSFVDVQERIKTASRCSRALTSMLRGQSVGRKEKIVIYDVVIKPVALYGSQAWTLTARCRDALTTFENQALRRMVGWDHSGGYARTRSNVEIRDILKYRKYI
ncbi:hypothetical protein FOCC_FOCC017371, partial [Frankliniella occidentalis]